MSAPVSAPACPLAITKALIARPSVTPTDAGAQVYLGELLQDMGFVVHHLPYGEVANLYARLGDQGPHLCFGGHTDVVPPGNLEQWRYPPFQATVDEGVLYGRGAVDLKGAIGAFVAAVHGFVSQNGPLTKGSISLLITGDEEGDAIDGTARVLEWMQARGEIPDAVLVGEPTNPSHLGQEIKIGRRGSLSGVLSVTGQQGHVAYPEKADNPLPGLVRLLSALSDTVFDQGTDFFPPTNLEITSIDTGNPSSNVIPAKAEAKFNVRFNDQWNSEQLEEKIRSVLDSTGAPYDLQCRHNSQSFGSEPGTWANTVQSAVKAATGKTAAFTATGGTSDAKYIHKYAPVVEFGLINTSAHQIDEHVAVKDIHALSEIYRQVLVHYFD